MATKLKFHVQGDLVNNPVLIQAEDGAYEAPNSYQLPHRYYYDAETASIKDKYAGKTDRQVQEIEHAAAIALATEQGLPPPPPLPAA
jgi:hypothetical protein